MSPDLKEQLSYKTIHEENFKSFQVKENHMKNIWDLNAFRFLINYCFAKRSDIILFIIFI